jgi:branched-chain amino acid transport system substrate-binding protein
MVENDKVVAFYGTYAVTSLQAVVPYLERVRVPIVGASGGNEAEDHSPMVFNPQTGADLGTVWSFLIALTTQSDARKVAILYCNEASTCANQNQRIAALAHEVGVEVVYSGRMSIAQPDYTADMLAARNAGAEAVMCVCDPPTQIRMIRSARRQNWSPVFSASHNLNQEQIKAGGDEVEGLLGASTTAPYMTSPLLRPYVEAVARYVPGGALGGLGASAWTQGRLLERIAPFLDGPAPAAADILRGLHSLRNETLGGLVPPITFTEGPHERVNLCVVPLRFERGLFRPLDGRDDNFRCPPGYRPGSG